MFCGPSIVFKYRKKINVMCSVLCVSRWVSIFYDSCNHYVIIVLWHREHGCETDHSILFAAHLFVLFCAALGSLLLFFVSLWSTCGCFFLLVVIQTFYNSLLKHNKFIHFIMLTWLTTLNFAGVTHEKASSAVHRTYLLYARHFCFGDNFFSDRSGKKNCFH